MLRAIDRTRRDAPLYPGSAKALRDFIDPKHLLIRIDANFDFASLVEFVLSKYNPDLGRPAIHPEVLVRALLLSAVYDVPSYRQLCERIGENLAWRWFCHLALEDAVFDHSTITVFIERLGPESFTELLDRLNNELVRLRLVSRRMYMDSSLVEADARTENLAPTDLPKGEFKQRARPEGDTFVLPERHPPGPEDGNVAHLTFLRYQDPSGHLPLSDVDPDARWRKIGKRVPVLGYKENLIVDKSGFILARGVSRANVSDAASIEPLLDRLPIEPRSLAADTGYRSLRLRFLLHARGIKAFIPLHPKDDSKDTQALLDGAFSFHGDHLLCKAGKVLSIGGFPDSKDVIQFVAKETECRVCELKASCLSKREKHRHVAASKYHFELVRARSINQSPRFTREMERRKTAVEGVFAHLDHLAWDRARMRGLGRVDIQGSIAALAHNVLKALTKRRFGKRVALSCPVLHAPTPRQLTSPFSFLLLMLKPNAFPSSSWT